MTRPAPAPVYSALIRTHAITPLLAQVVADLQAQSWPPRRIVFVDSSRDPAVSEQLAKLGDVVPYPGADFNYSTALNVGLAHITEPQVLLISAHVRLERPDLIERTLTTARSHDIDVLYWCFAGTGHNRQTVIRPDDFNGRNGLSNACAFLPTALVRQRPFRPEVFSAEDQEWTAWYFREHRRSVLRCEDVAVTYHNPHLNERKIINEELAIAYFVSPRERWLDRVAHRAGRALLALLRGHGKRARMHWDIARGLLMMWFRPPTGGSKYF